MEFLLFSYERLCSVHFGVWHLFSAFSWFTPNKKVSTRDTEISLFIRSPKPPGGVYSGVVKTQSAKSCSNFIFQGWGGGGLLSTKSQFRVNWNFLPKISTTEASYCITDSLSHTTYVGDY